MIVCADDFGLREDIDQAILELCSLGKLSAVSCLVVLARCNSEAIGRLTAHPLGVDVGLHLCLTDEGLPPPLSASGRKSIRSSFTSLFRYASPGGLRSREVFQQVSAQYELFVQKSGRRPDHIDGHLHAHQLPAVRCALLDFVLSLPADRRPSIRNTYMPLSEIRRQGLPWMKAFPIGVYGARMRRDLVAAGLPTNDGFVGIYDFKRWRRYPCYLPKFADCLRRHGPNSILVVHPGMRENWRSQEYESLRTLSLPGTEPNRFQKGMEGGAIRQCVSAERPRQ